MRISLPRVAPGMAGAGGVTRGRTGCSVRRTSRGIEPDERLVRAVLARRSLNARTHARLEPGKLAFDRHSGSERAAPGWRRSSRTIQTLAIRSSGQVAAASACFAMRRSCRGAEVPDGVPALVEDPDAGAPVADADVGRTGRVARSRRELECSRPTRHARQAEHEVLDLRWPAFDRLTPTYTERAAEVDSQWSIECRVRAPPSSRVVPLRPSPRSISLIRVVDRPVSRRPAPRCVIRRRRRSLRMTSPRWRPSPAPPGCAGDPRLAA